MEIIVVNLVKIGDKYFGIRIYKVKGQYLQHHISIAVFPFKISIMYIYPLERIDIEIKLFLVFHVHFGIGVSNA